MSPPGRLPRITAHCLCGAFLRVRDSQEVADRMISFWRGWYHRGPECREVSGDVAAMSRKERKREGIAEEP